MLTFWKRIDFLYDFRSDSNYYYYSQIRFDYRNSSSDLPSNTNWPHARNTRSRKLKKTSCPMKLMSLPWCVNWTTHVSSNYTKWSKIRWNCASWWSKWVAALFSICSMRNINCPKPKQRCSSINCARVFRTCIEWTSSIAVWSQLTFC